MISVGQNARQGFLIALLAAAAGCGVGPDADQNENAIIDPPAQCAPDRPDCSSSLDYPVASDLTVDNSAGLRFSGESGGLVIDRVSELPDIDGDGVPDDADECPGTPDWISCDDDPSNDGVYATVFYDPSGSNEAVRSVTVTTTSDIPKVDVYFLIDATPTLSEEIAALQGEILSIIDDVRSEFGDARFGLGLYRQYPLSPLAAPYSQSPYHHIVDLTDDDALIDAAFSTLNTVANSATGTAATQALFSVASGSGLGDMVANRGECPNAEDIGYPCFRPEALHVVMNVTDDLVYNGPQVGGLQYGDPPFNGLVGGAVMDRPPVAMFPQLLNADTAALALDLGDLSGRSLTLLGMSTLLTNQVNTAQAPGCASPPPMPGDPPGADMDDKDVVLTFRFDAPIGNVTASADNTHWPGANVALFDSALLAPITALACDGGVVGNGSWGAITWTPTTSQQYYLVADGIVPAADPGSTPEGAFSISILHDGDPANPTWLTTDAPVAWTEVETALLASDIRVASVVTLRDAMSMSSDGSIDARLIALVTNALTKNGDQWVTELASASGAGLGTAVSDTIALARTESVYDISLTAVDNDSTLMDERDFILSIRWEDCADETPLQCDRGSGQQCRGCDVGAVIDFEVLFMNSSVAPTTESQVFDFELLVRADDDIEVERIPVRVMVPDARAHEFDVAPEAAFYRNAYDTTTRCNSPSDRPKWGDLRWDGSTPDGTSIEFQIRTAPTLADLPTAVPAIVEIPTDTSSDTFNITEELVADGQLYGFPYLQITAILNPSNSPPATPSLEGWSFEFVCEAAE